MPEGRFASVVLVVEDQMHERFFRRWLREHVRVNHRDIRVVAPPPGSGSGEQFVRRQFPVEVRQHRIVSARRGALLLGVIDADVGEWRSHYEQLRTGVNAGDDIFVFVPKRNIETWLHQLNGLEASEEDSYKRLYREDANGAILRAVAVFSEAVSSLEARLFVPSLTKGVEEARRVPRRHKR